MIFTERSLCLEDFADMDSTQLASVDAYRLALAKQRSGVEIR